MIPRMAFSFFIVVALFFARIYSLDWIHVNPQTSYMENPQGSTMIFHGANVVYKIPPWLPPVEYDPMNSFNESDIKIMQDLGFNIVRLGVMWAGVRKNGKTDQQYLDKIENLVRLFSERGIYTLIDLHQDLMSRFYCGEGAPDELIKEVHQR